MDSIHKEALAVVTELKHFLSLHLCNEIPDEQFRVHQERLLNDFNGIAARMPHGDEFEAAF